MSLDKRREGRGGVGGGVCIKSLALLFPGSVREHEHMCAKNAEEVLLS